MHYVATEKAIIRKLPGGTCSRLFSAAITLLLVTFASQFAVAGQYKIRLLESAMQHFPEATEQQLMRLGEPLLRDLAQGSIPTLLVMLRNNAETAPLPYFASSEARQKAIARRLVQRRFAIEQAVEAFKNSHRTLGNSAPVAMEYSHLPIVVVRASEWRDIRQLLRNPQVISVSSDEPMHRLLSFSKPLINQPIAIANGIDGSGTTVAVFDSGVDYTGAAFGSCSSPGVPSGCRVLHAEDFAPDDGLLDDDGHGTFVSGIVAGVAEQTNLVVLDVFDGSSAYSSDVIDAINWAVANVATYNIVAGNFSLGNGQEYGGDCDSFFPPPSSNPYKSAFDAMRAVGMLPVVASGNEAHTSGISSPACVSSALSVGATYNAAWPPINWSTTPPCSDSSIAADDIACFSNSGPNLDILAPGSIISAVGTTSSGTSMAAPMVAGAVALVSQQLPLESPEQREQRLKTSDTQILDSRNGLTFPRLDIRAALDLYDNDGDGVPALNDPDDADPCVPSQFAAGCSTDSDSDGKTDAEEGEFTDSDGDGIPDYQESAILDADGDGYFDEQDPANDNACEPSQFAGTCLQDSDGDGKTDAAEGEFTDSDSDGIVDYLESAIIDADSDGAVDELDPDNNDPCIPSQFVAQCDRDSDGDGKTDAEEGEFADIDSDGIADYLESALEDQDGDGLQDEFDPDNANPCIPSQFAGTCPLDSDGDGISDADEGATSDSDGDGTPDYLESLLEDADNDGVADQLDPADGDPCIPNIESDACALPQVNVPLPPGAVLAIAALFALAGYSCNRRE